MKTIPNYHPPQDYRRPTKTQEKVYVPVNDYPEINFSMLANPLTLLTSPNSQTARGTPPGVSRASAVKLCLAGRSCGILTRSSACILSRLLTLSSPHSSWLTHRTSW